MFTTTRGNNPVKYVEPDRGAILEVATVLAVAVIADMITGNQVSGAMFGFADEYMTMCRENFKENDHYHYAMANSRAAQGGPLGKTASQALSFAREATDALKGDGKRDIREDNIANRHWRDIQSNVAPQEHNARFDVRQGGSRTSLPDVEDSRPKNPQDFLDTYFTRDPVND